MDADCSFYVKSIATYAPAFFGYNSLVLASVGSKVISQRDKTLFFHQKSEGILHLLFAGIACKIYFLMPSNFDEKNAIVF